MVTVKCITWYIRLIRLDSLLVVTRTEASWCQASSFTAALHSLRIWPIMWNTVRPGLCWTTGGMFRVNRDILGKGTGRNRNSCDDWGGQQPRGNLTTLLPTGDKQTHKSFKKNWLETQLKLWQLKKLKIVGLRVSGRPACQCSGPLSPSRKLWRSILGTAMAQAAEDDENVKPPQAAASSLFMFAKWKIIAFAVDAIQ